jgi:hypothetical protein
MKPPLTSRMPLLLTIATLGVGLTLTTSGPGFAGAAAPDRATSFAFQSSGFGSRVNGGKIPVGSSTTSYQHIGCTNLAGRDKVNDVADATVPGLGTLSGVRTRTWTTMRHGVAAAHSTHSIAELTLGSSGVGSLTIDAIHSLSKAFHDRSGFHSTTSTTIGDITFTPTAGPPQTFPAPTPDQPLTIPGLATITLGRSSSQHGSLGASASADALVVDVVATGTKVKVAHTHASIGGGLTSGIFRGHSNATRVVTALTDLAHSGPQPLSLMGCLGTRGHRVTKSLAAVDVGGQLVVTGLSSSQRSSQDPRGHGFEQASIARVNLGHGQLVVHGIVGMATVEQTASGLSRSAKGTQVGSITAGGKTVRFPRTGVLQIPGVAKLERHVVSRSATGIKVVALRLTVLDGSGAVINLGEAQLQIHRLSH